MAQTNVEKIERSVIANLPRDRRPREDEVYALASECRLAWNVSDEEFTALLHALHAKFAITMDMGTALLDSVAFKPWLSARKASINPYYWERFSEYLLRQSWPPLIINTLDRVSDELLDLSGDPKKTGNWKRRGLVVGDVQSGKTGTYTALSCKAADAGYKLIILLTGTLETLRRQTQERLDEGFVGLDSAEILQTGIRTNRLVGVGHIDATRTAGVFTSKSRDFNKGLINQLGFRLASWNEPWLVVVKKNKRILENLEEWLRSYNADDDGKIDVPMLLIDDEADSASINTNATSADPTAINAQINKLLRLFRRSTYAGFTATPFANVFIVPETDDEMVKDDLFPRDFIYSLEAPNNYIGPRKIFGDERHDFLETIDDAEAFFPASQTSTAEVAGLPPSLQTAMLGFIIANAYRDICGEGQTHRSMLVNVSRFTNIQNQVADLLDADLRSIQRQIRSFAKLSEIEALENSQALRDLHNLWLAEYSEVIPSWITLQDALNEAASPVVVKSVNQTASRLDYAANVESGLRVIAVGGQSLSRGLTLEGLSTSYFYRNSQMYDTLLQMGRWFGYRDGYLEVCRLWITEEAADWYAYIMEASDELRRDIKHMKSLSLTPKDFGLKVRAHPNSLIVTARNKMRSAETIIRNVSLSGQSPEAARLRANVVVEEANLKAVGSFIRDLAGAGISHVGRPPAPYFWTGVPADLVAEFLASFQVHPLNFDFQVEVIARFLNRTTEERLQLWDVAVAGGDETTELVAGLDIKPLKRRLKKTADGQTLMISGTKLRVGSGGITRIGLSRTEIDAALEYAAKETRTVTDKDYARVRSRPLLILYFIRGYERAAKDDPEVSYEPDRNPLVSIGLSFPTFDDSAIANRAEYRVNTVEWRALIETEQEDDVAEADGDEP